MTLNIDEKDGGVTLNVRVIPRSARSEVVGEHDGALKVKLSAPPVEGAANDELIRLLAREFGLSRSAIDIVSGQRSKAKRVRMDAIDSSRILAVLKAKT